MRSANEKRCAEVTLRNRHRRADVRQRREPQHAPCDGVAYKATDPGRQAPLPQHVPRDLALVERDEELGRECVRQRQQAANVFVTAAERRRAVSTVDDHRARACFGCTPGERDRGDDEIGVRGPGRRQQLDSRFAQTLGPAGDSVEDDRRRRWVREREAGIDRAQAQRRISS